MIPYGFGLATGVAAGIALTRAWYERSRPPVVHQHVAAVPSTPLVDQLRREMAAAERRNLGAF